MARIALVTHWDWVLYNFRLPLARRLRSRGLDVVFICPRGEFVPKLEAAGFPWRPWPVSRRGMNPLQEITSIASLTRLYRREAFALVQQFTIKPILYGSLAAGRAGIPAVINTFTGLGFLFSNDIRARGLRAVALPLLRSLLRRPSTQTLFQTLSDRQVFVDTGLVPSDRAHVIPGSGVDVARFHPAEPQASRGEVVVLMASRLLLDKGIAEFVESARDVRSRGIKARFVVAGQADHGNPSCVPAEMLERWRAEGAVEFLGQRDDMPDLLRRTSIAVLPSYHEGVPRFLLEAAATGLPLVASDIEGCRSIVRPGVNGVLVPPKDSTSLTEAIARLATDAELRALMGAASRSVAVQSFRDDAILDQYEAVYRRAGVLT